VPKSKAFADNALHAVKDNKTVLRFEKKAIRREKKAQIKFIS